MFGVRKLKSSVELLTKQIESNNTSIDKLLNTGIALDIRLRAASELLSRLTKRVDHLEQSLSNGKQSKNNGGD